MALLEFTLYNRPQQLFTHGRIFLELTSSGAVAAGHKFQTIKMISYSSTDDLYRIIVEVTWLCFAVVYIFQELNSMLFDQWEEKHVLEGKA